MEEQIPKVYTFNMFRKFQEELKATMYCDVLPIQMDGPVMNFQVRVFVEDGKPTENKDHEVLYNADKLEVDDTPVSRYDYLTIRCLHLAELGFVSDDRYQVALKLLKEVEKSLLDDIICRQKQPRLLSFETQANGNVQNLLLAQIGTSGVNKNLSSLHVKRRGRPQIKAKESDMETLAQPNKEQDFLRSSLMGSESNTLQSSATATPLNTQRIDLMEDTTTVFYSYLQRSNNRKSVKNAVDLSTNTTTRCPCTKSTFWSKDRDKPLLPRTTYDDYVELKLNTEKITIYGKLRKLESSSEREGWARDSRQGLLEPPKPKVKENNLMKVLGFEAAQDSAKVRKLTPAE
ncbi:hypothetical protein ZIOFF_031639 [Zingiber officinale]|uniref:Pre-mRNA-splicing factor 3 domain-containing protein n=1 Tax=Zingiber officinale TaxID=94328 RepID=A0A8J5LAY9_ZINOF|nr:hypothetical protein ZIOFF_031639 [Zingiber officinale]